MRESESRRNTQSGVEGDVTSMIPKMENISTLTQNSLSYQSLMSTIWLLHTTRHLMPLNFVCYNFFFYLSRSTSIINPSYRLLIGQNHDLIKCLSTISCPENYSNYRPSPRLSTLTPNDHTRYIKFNTPFYMRTHYIYRLLHTWNPYAISWTIVKIQVQLKHQSNIQ